MSNYPPPGQAHPDQPSDPWQEAPLWGGQQTTQPYGEPSGYVGEQYSPAPVGYPPPTQQAQPWGPAQPPPGKGGLSTVALALLTALAVVVLGGGALGVYLYSTRDKATSGAQTTPTSGTHSTATATHSPTSKPSPTEQDFKTVTIGQCLVNRGPDGNHPDMHVVACGPGTYQLVQRFDGTVDEGKCEGISSIRFHYDDHATNRFVYCLKKLS